MKQGHKATWTERKIIEAFGLDARDWLVSKNTSTEMVLVHKHTDQVRTIPKNLL